MKNLAALWVNSPDLARAIEPLLDAGPAYSVEASRHGELTLMMPDPTKRKIHVHSKFEPLAEAGKLIDVAHPAERSAFYVLGLGLGYHVRALFERAGDDATIFVFEPDLQMIRTALELADFSALFDSRRVEIISVEDKAALFGKLQPHIASITTGFQCVRHAPSAQLRPAFHAQMAEWVHEFEAYAKTTINTLVLNGRRTAENIARNLPWYVATPGIDRLKDAYKGEPAIIVSAGPSLRKNKHLIKGAAGKAVIISVQTTLQPLLEMGVEPTIVTSLDYHDICTRFFEKLPKGIKTELVAEPKATSKIFDLHPGALSLLGNEFAENLLGEMKLNKARLPSGATVAHLSYYLAEHLGCDPIIFVGQDLGFSDALCYSPGTSYDDVWRPELGPFCTLEMKQWEQIVREKHILRKVPDHEGRPTYTEERLFTYLQHFERDFAKSKSKIIDATEGGVLKRGARTMKLAEAIAAYCSEPLSRSELPSHGGLQWELLGACEASLRQRAKDAREIEEISRLTQPLLEEVRDHLDDQARVNRTIAKIDPLRAKMSALSSALHLVMQLSQRTELQRLQADLQISAAKAEGSDKQRRQVQRDIDNVSGVIDAARDFVTLIDDALTVIAEFRGRLDPKATEGGPGSPPRDNPRPQKREAA